MLNTQQFIDIIKVHLDSSLLEYELHILEDKLPLGIEFLVISKEFQTLSRGVRIEFMADLVAKSFGLPLDFGPAGLALTPDEYEQLNFPTRALTKIFSTYN